MMDSKEKEKLIEKVNALIAKEEYEEAADALICSGDCREDYELSCLLAVVFNGMGDEKTERFFTAAEALLMRHYERGVGDPNWLYIFARVLYSQGRSIQAMDFMDKIFGMKDESMAQRLKYYDEAKEFYETLYYMQVENAQLYSEEQNKAVMAHIEKYFGGPDYYKVDPSPNGIKVGIAVVYPTPERNFYTLVTVGMGAHRMKTPPELKNEQLERAELVMYMPPDWKPRSRDIRHSWIIKEMRRIARLPLENDTWLGYGHLISDGSPIAPNTEQEAVLLISLQDTPDAALRCPLPNGESVVFYQLFPIYKQEMEYKLARGATALIDLMPHISAVYDPERENVCKDMESGGGSPLLVGETNYLVGKLKKLGVSCAVSRKISREGERVGFMKRFLMDDSELSQMNTSGWLMLSGSESREYLADPFNIEIASLNTICNIDPAIVKYLDMPYGTDLTRCEGDEFVQTMHVPPKEKTYS